MSVIFVDLRAYDPAPFVENPVSAARSLAYLAGCLGEPNTYSDPAHVRAWQLGKAWRLAKPFRGVKVTQERIEAKAA